ncbi:MAG: HDOD domain-containing protein [Verrucomicrobiota bacterium]
MAETLPAAPRVLAELQTLLQDPNNGLEEITGVLRQDIGLTSRVIRIANGVMFNKGGSVGSLEEALGRIGFNEVYRLAGIAALAQMASFELAFYGVSALRLRENALLVGLLMEELAFAAEADARVAYTVGLMRPTSRIVLDATAQRDLRGASVPTIGPRRLAEWEAEVFGVTGQEVGTVVLKGWRFPAEVFVPIRDHYLHSLVVDPLPLAKVLHVAATLAEMRGFGLPGETAYWEAGAEEAAANRDLTQDVIDGATERTMLRFERLRAVLN